MPDTKTLPKLIRPESENGKGLDAMSCSAFNAWKASDDSDSKRLELQAKWANLQQMRDRARSAYEADVKARPNYHDGTPRKTWEQLGDVEQWSWGRDYNLEANVNVEGREGETPESNTTR